MNPPIRQLSYNQQLHSDIEHDDGIDLRKFFSVLIDNRWFIAGIMMIFIVVGLVYALLAEPRFESTILVHVEENAPEAKNIPGDLSSAFDLKAAASAEIEILRSRMVVGRAVDATQLYIDVQPKYFPVIGAGIARYNKKLSDPGLFGYGGSVWGAERAELSMFNVPETLEGVGFTLVASGNGGYRMIEKERGIEIPGEVGKVVVARVAQGEIHMRVDRLDAKPGAEFVVSRAPRIVTVENLQKSLKISEKGKQSGVISVALEGRDPQRTTAVLSEIGREYMRQNEYRKSEAAEKTLVVIERQLPRLKQELESSEARYNEVRNKHGTIDLGEEGKGLLQQSISTQTKLIELRQKKEELLVQYQNAHPLVISIDRQMRSLNRDMAAVNARIKRLPEVEQDVVRLNRDVQVNRDVYTAVLSTAQQLRLVTASKTGNVRLIDSPETPVVPVKPRRSLTVMVAALLGLAVGCVAALMRKNLGGRVDDPDEIEQMLGMNVCATIPHDVSAPKPKPVAYSPSGGREVALLSDESSSGGTIESLLRFHASLPYTMVGARNNIIMVTGPTPGVGKSFVSANFATVLGSMGKSVLLIDGDLRTGHLHRYFGVERDRGLTDVIRDPGLLERVVFRSVADNLDLISTGAFQGRPAHVLAHPNFGKLLQTMSSRYDLVLIDTAPVLAVSDALIVGLHAGTVFNIVRGGVSTMWEIEETVKRLQQAGVTVTGTIFNDLKSRLGRYGYGYGYQYGYG